MKLVLLAGGLGTRLSEETDATPKPMVEVGGKPTLWHIMKHYSHFGINEFIVCLGYKGYVIKEYFSNYFLHMADVTIDLSNNSVTAHNNKADPWKITLIDTGKDTMTGGRLKRVQEYVGKETFCMTYGDGFSNVDIPALLKFHYNTGLQCTVTAVQAPGRFGSLCFGNGPTVESFVEKPYGDGGWINGGYFVLEPEIFKLIENDSSVWEQSPLKALASNSQLAAYRHTGFWQPMDTLRDKRLLEDLWSANQAPWKVWS